MTSFTEQEDPVETLAAELSALVPQFKRSVAGAVNGRLAECLAFYWFISLSTGLLTQKSVGALIGALGTSMVGASWSDWALHANRSSSSSSSNFAAS